MSIVAFDGSHILYDGICVGGVCGSRQFHVDKVRVSNDKRFVACSVGVWGVACAVTQEFFDMLEEAPDRLANKMFFPVTPLDESIREEYSGDIYIIDNDLQCIWMYDEYANGFCRIPLEPFVIGHERAMATVILSLGAVSADKWDKMVFDLRMVAMSHHFNDRVTAPPYKLLSLSTGEEKAL